MTELRKAAEMALEDICGAKLCEVNSMSSRAEMLRLMDKAAEALRQALAQPDLARVGEVGIWCDCGDGIMPNSGAKCGNCLAAESAAREWVGLTDDDYNIKQVGEFDVVKFAKYIEAKLKEKNGG